METLPKSKIPRDNLLSRPLKGQIVKPAILTLFSESFQPIPTATGGQTSADPLSEVEEEFQK